MSILVLISRVTIGFNVAGERRSRRAERVEDSGQQLIASRHRDEVRVDLETRQPGVIRDQTASRSTIGKRPPLIQRRVVVNVRGEAEATAIGAGLVGGVERVAGNPETVDEDRLRRNGRGLNEHKGREGTENS